MRKQKLADKVVEKEKKKLKKKTKKTFRRVVGVTLGGVGLFCTGYLFGLHHRVIVAMIKGEEVPKASKCHCLHR